MRTSGGGVTAAGGATPAGPRGSQTTTSVCWGQRIMSASTSGRGGSGMTGSMEATPAGCDLSEDLFASIQNNNQVASMTQDRGHGDGHD